MQPTIALSLEGDVHSAQTLSQWLRRGAPSCVVSSGGGAPTAGEKGIDLTATLLITLLGTPAVAQLIDCLKAYITTTPQVTIKVTRSDGSNLGIVATHADPDSIGTLAERLATILDERG